MASQIIIFIMICFGIDVFGWNIVVTNICWTIDFSYVFYGINIFDIAHF